MLASGETVRTHERYHPQAMNDLTPDYARAAACQQATGVGIVQNVGVAEAGVAAVRPA